MMFCWRFVGVARWALHQVQHGMDRRRLTQDNLRFVGEDQCLAVERLRGHALTRYLPSASGRATKEKLDTAPPPPMTMDWPVAAFVVTVERPPAGVSLTVA